MKNRPRSADEATQVLDQLTEVAIALSTERDYRKLLDLILAKAVRLANCDAGSLYILAADPEGGRRRLRFVAAQNDSVSVPLRETEMPLTMESLAGCVALTGEPLLIDDAYAIPRGAPYHFNRAFDEGAGYRTKSLLVLPMTNHKGRVTGVLQLINRKRDGAAGLDSPAAVERWVVPFDDRDARLMRAVGSLAAVSIDNQQLYESIERLFEGFVKASVTAIEQRDPTTSGHSLRVSALTVDLADKVNRTPSGVLGSLAFSGEQMRELRYAALLHDFGKVGVREHVLVKAKKLYPFELERIQTRFEVARLCLERDTLLRKLAAHREARPDLAARLEALDRDLDAQRDELAAFYEAILRSNEPSVLPEGDFEALQAIAGRSFTDGEGKSRAILLPEEARILSIRKGSLSEPERLEIESHVTHTFNFLRQIPWTPELGRIPEIAYGHHEKLNGRGYPRGVTAQSIPVQSRIMAVSDIFDALTASDRPYKRAVPVAKALDILRSEAGGGLLDEALVDLFIEAKVYEVVSAGAPK